MSASNDDTDKKRKRNDEEEKEKLDSDDDDDFGPKPAQNVDDEEAGPSLAPLGVTTTNHHVVTKPKKLKKLSFDEKIQLERMPSALMYERSYMHRDSLTHICVTKSDFVITASKDGIVKFWKKNHGGIEFVKLFRSHLAPITSLCVSNNGFLLASISADKTLKIYDVVDFDMTHMIKLSYTPRAACWIHSSSQAKGIVAVSSAETGDIYIYKADGSNEPIHTLQLHSAPVHLMKYNETHECVISIDTNGMIEYWSTGDYELPHTLSFRFKSDTDLYEFAKTKSKAMSLEISPNGKYFSIMGSDRHIRIFHVKNGKLFKKIDETLEVYNETQKSGSDKFKIDSIDFGRRMAVEREIDKALKERDDVPAVNILFDDSSNFISYATMLGIKIINIHTNKLVALLGKVENTERFMSISLFQGIPREVGQSAEAQLGSALIKAESNAIESKRDEDPSLFCIAYRKERFYIFSKREPENPDSVTMGRDIYNEKPMKDHQKLAAAPQAPSSITGVIIHTTMGDISLQLHVKETPKTCENFTTHAKNGYYNNTIFHRVIKDFMIQAGDPLGDGTGGESIWGGEFQDEFNRALRHDRAGILSMANAGPNTNGSQFFITTVPCPWLDNKHTVFGRVTKGMDVVHAIEKLKVNKDNNRPLEDVKIINIETVFG